MIYGLRFIHKRKHIYLTGHDVDSLCFPKCKRLYSTHSQGQCMRTRTFTTVDGAEAVPLRCGILGKLTTSLFPPAFFHPTSVLLSLSNQHPATTACVFIIMNTGHLLSFSICCMLYNILYFARIFSCFADQNQKSDVNTFPGLGKSTRCC